MSGIASILLKKGESVSGSDLKLSAVTDKLKKEGARVSQGHSAANVGYADIVVYSSAIKEENPELKEARRRGIEIYSRARMLAEIMLGHKVVTVTGAHGKTTTTSLISHLLQYAGLSPTVAVGGILANIEDNASFGNGSFFVAEADESDGSFLCYSPDYSVITNLDFEHMDFYGTEEKLFAAFSEFINKTRDNGIIFACGDDRNLRQMLAKSGKKSVLFGLDGNTDVYAGDIVLNGFSSEFDCYAKGAFLGRFHLPLAGRHNVSNALAVIAVGSEAGVKADVMKEAMACFRGIGRRFQVRAELKDERIIVVEDYGHHPTEIKRTLEAVKSCKYDRIICAFQPHRYTRTRLLMDEFTKCFDAADHLILTDIYAASEQPIEGIDSRVLYRNIQSRLGGRVEFARKAEISARIERILRPGDFVIILGAGDITEVCDELVERIGRKAEVR